MKSILRNPTRKEKRNAHKRACAAAGMPAEERIGKLGVLAIPPSARRRC